MSVIRAVEQEHIQELSEMMIKGKDQESTKVNLEEAKNKFLARPDRLEIGDLVKVSVKIIEGKRERLQIFEGYVIAIKGSGMSKTFKVRKIAFGVGVERTFPLFSPKIDNIQIVRRGRVRRRAYYLRDKW